MFLKLVIRPIDTWDCINNKQTNKKICYHLDI